MLIVDDEPLLLRSLARAVEAWGYYVREATSAPLAIAAAQEELGLGLVLLDHGVAGEHDGVLVEALRKVRPGVRVLYMSGYDLASTGLALAGDGSEAFIAKPFTQAELLQQIRQLLASPETERRRGAAGEGAG